MSINDIRNRRHEYAYIPARLIEVEDGTPFSFNIGERFLLPIPGKSKEVALFKNQMPQASHELDAFHNKLLWSDNEIDVLHGLMSVVFWGFASGADNKPRIERALSRSRQILNGKNGKKGWISPTDRDQIIKIIFETRDLVKAYDIENALLSAMKIKFLGMSFASKLLAFLDPNKFTVYDDVISKRLMHIPDVNLSNMYVSTNNQSKSHKIKQSKIYSLWCHWCYDQAKNLNADNILWLDWDGSTHQWRAIDVERAFFALGR